VDLYRLVAKLARADFPSLVLAVCIICFAWFTSAVRIINTIHPFFPSSETSNNKDGFEIYYYYHQFPLEYVEILRYAYCFYPNTTGYKKNIEK
jgi:hypothetical protein